MYARYTPSTTEKKPREEPPTTTSQRFVASTDSLYSRYVPTPKTTALQKRKIVFEYDDEISAPAESTPDDTGKRKSKKAKRSHNDEDGNASLPATTTIEAPRETAHIEKPSQTEKKKEKKKERKKGEREETQNEQIELLVAPEDPKPPSGVSPVPQLPTTVNGKVKDKKKKRKHAEKDGSDSGGGIEGNPKTRHKSLLEKKDRSLKRAKKSSKPTERQAETEPHQDPADGNAVVEEVHGLGPLPQPEPIPIDTTKPTYETLPAWLANPIRVSADTRTPFTELGMDPELGITSKVEKVLQAKGWKEAFAVQTAVIPCLLPSRERRGDVVISAATGSGKTLAYVLPMVRDISRGVQTKMRGVVVVPTRELVQQVQDVCETCSRAYTSPNSKRVRIGVAMGSHAFKKEQAALTEGVQIYDPTGYRAYIEKRAKWPFGTEADDDLNLDPFEETIRPLPQHVVRHISKVDILICTPGRLVEHLNSTPGFTLDHVRWLVVDEADKLLGQSYQQWLDVVIPKLSVMEPGARDFPDSNESGVRKVVLSATMTRDLSLLSSLKLSRPRHIVLEGTQQTIEEVTDATEYALPGLLKESAIKIREEGQKPLYLVELLRSSHITPSPPTSFSNNPRPAAVDLDDDATSSSGSDSDATDSEDDSRSHQGTTSGGFPSTALIFTKSNETALRLSRLLAILAPHLESLIGTLTSTTRTSERRRVIRAFQARKTRILVASDLTARGIDLPDLDHVINYDMPPSAEVYVHRVGRTARAGRTGHSWTLFTKKEAGWFWPEVAGKGKSRGTGAVIKRAGKVEQVAIGGAENEGEDAGPAGVFGDDRMAEYEAALEQLGQEAGEMRKKRG